MAFATLVLLPGVAMAQAGSPPAVAPQVIETTPPQVLAEMLPRTGSNLIPMIGIALALVVLGVLLVVSVRRRRTNDVRLA